MYNKINYYIIKGSNIAIYSGETIKINYFNVTFLGTQYYITGFYTLVFSYNITLVIKSFYITQYIIYI